jgi:hypothetical protein
MELYNINAVLERATFLSSSNKLNNFQIYAIAKKIQNSTHSDSVFVKTKAKFRAIVILKTFVKQNNVSNKTYRCVHDLLLYQTSFVHVQRFMGCLHKTLCCKSFRLLDEGSIQEGSLLLANIHNHS